MPSIYRYEDQLIAFRQVSDLINAGFFAGYINVGSGWYVTFEIKQLAINQKSCIIAETQRRVKMTTANTEHKPFERDGKKTGHPRTRIGATAKKRKKEASKGVSK